MKGKSSHLVYILTIQSWKYCNYLDGRGAIYPGEVVGNIIIVILSPIVIPSGG